MIGAGEIGKIREAPEVAETVSGVGQAIASGMDPITAGIVGIGGLLSMFLGEKGDK